MNRLRKTLHLGLGLAALAANLPAQDEPAETAANVVTLPPFLVDRGEGRRAQPWYIIEAPGFTVLSTGSEQIGPEFADYYLQQTAALNRLVPAKYRWHSSVPELVVLINEAAGTVARDEALQTMLDQDRSATATGGRRIAKALPNLQINGRDRTALFATHQRSDAVERAVSRGSALSSFNASMAGQTPVEFAFTPSRVGQFLARRTPALPPWVVQGLIGLWAQSAFGDDLLRLNAAYWRSPAETDALRLDSDRPRDLFPLPLFFSRNPMDLEPARAKVWREQAVLFTRWALFAEGGPGPDAFWGFVDDVETRPLTEALFRRHFGLGFADARDRLADYLPDATQEEIDLTFQATAERAPRQRRATPAESGRLRAEWERLQVGFVRAQHPELASHYLRQARSTIELTRQNSGDHPDLQATAGLLEFEAGNHAEARRELTAALAGGNTRPEVRQTLAQLIYAGYRAQLPPNGRLDIVQVADLQKLLEPALDDEPLLLETATLYATVWLNAENPPAPVELNRLLALARRFPSEPTVILPTAVIFATQGRIGHARQLVMLARQLAPDEKTRTAFDPLWERLSAL